MKTKMFLIKTEAHLMISLFIIQQFIGLGKKFKFEIYYPSESSRLTIDKYNTSIGSEISFQMISFPNQALRLDDGSKIQLNKIISQNIDEFIFFGRSCIFSNYLAILLSKKRVTISLAQDGTTAYFKSKAFPVRTIISYLYQYLKFVIINRVEYPGMFIYKANWGMAKYIDRLWLTQPEMYKYSSKEAKSIVDENAFYDSFNLVQKVFKYAHKIPSKDVILYLNSPMRRDKKALKAERDLFQHIVKSARGKKQIYVKPHPSTESETINFFSSFENVSMIFDEVPAELIISFLSNSIILSDRSSALLINNNRCTFYWLSDYFDQYRDVKFIKTQNPTKHIKMVNHVSQIYFKN